MDESKNRRALVDKLIELGTKASKPGTDAGIRQVNQREFDELVQNTATPALIPALAFLIQPGRLPPELRKKFLDVLTHVPLRSDGVRATAEFIFSVHPSSTVSSSEEAAPQKNGANITQEALNMAAKMVAYPPSNVPEEMWYNTIAPQLFALLDGTDGAELMKVAAYVIGFGILGRKQSGAPGTAGWKAIAEPILRPINPSLYPDVRDEDASDEIIDLSKPAVLVKPEDLARALYRLQALLISHPNPSLSKRLLHRLILPLWALASWVRPQPNCTERYCLPAQNLLGIFLKLAAGPAGIQDLINNLLYSGCTEADYRWTFEETDNGDIQVVKPRASFGEEATHGSWDQVRPKVDSLVDLIKSICSDEDISTIFTTLFAAWLAVSDSKIEVELTPSVNGTDRPSPITLLVQVNLLQRLIDAFPSQLASRPDSILSLIEPILKRGKDKEEEDGTTPLALSLLNIVATAPVFQKARMDQDIIQSIECSLEQIGKAELGDTSTTARNLAMLLKYRDELDDPSEMPSAPSQRQLEDRKTYNLALSYITQADSPPPVRAEGLSLLQTLIASQSSALDIPATLVLLSSLLQDDEDYINLKVIKIFTQLANKHPRTVTKELVEHYVDANESSSVDTRLRFGEALLQVIERLGETFTGDAAKQVSEALLSTAGRRGYRPKTEERQKRNERLRQMRQARAEQEWGGAVPDLNDDEETEEDQADRELLTQIVSGWDSKKGSEDIRVRASALSIFAVAMETNLAGVGATLVTASVDMCANILTMETGVEAGILRRAAVLVILSFVRALDKAKEQGRRVGFGLTEDSQADVKRVLSYIAETDNDGLVRQHARDVVESLERWSLGSLVSEARTPGSGLAKLAGLSLNQGQQMFEASASTKPRPRIEEIG